MDFTRSTSVPTLLDLVNVLGRGSTDDWRRLYARAKAEPALRARIARALEMVDPETGEARALWGVLLDALDRRAPEGDAAAR
ncbi:MAG: hypothetical protein WKG32_19175 [Gemmatimonadaceae bacterium]